MNAAQQRLAEREQDHAHIAALEHINAVLIYTLVDISAGGERYGGWTAAKMSDVAREALAGAASGVE